MENIYEEWAHKLDEVSWREIPAKWSMKKLGPIPPKNEPIPNLWMQSKMMINLLNIERYLVVVLVEFECKIVQSFHSERLRAKERGLSV